MNTYILQRSIFGITEHFTLAYAAIYQRPIALLTKVAMWLLGIQYIYYNIEENDELYESYILKLSKINIRNLCRMNFNLTGLKN